MSKNGVTFRKLLRVLMENEIVDLDKEIIFSHHNNETGSDEFYVPTDIIVDYDDGPFGVIIEPEKPDKNDRPFKWLHE